MSRKGEADQLKRDWCELLQDARFCRVLWSILERAGIYSSAFLGDANDTYRLGHRNMALSIISDMIAAKPSAYPRLLAAMKYDETAALKSASWGLGQSRVAQVCSDPPHRLLGGRSRQDRPFWRLGMSPRTQQRLKAEPDEALSVEVSGKAWQFAETLAHAFEVFGTQEAAEHCRRNNEAVGITGALLFNAGVFAQVLEGPLEALEATFERIQQDERHGDVSLLALEPITHRTFTNWAMGFVGQSSTNAQRFADVGLTSGFDPARLGGQKVHEILRDLTMEEETVAA